MRTDAVLYILVEILLIQVSVVQSGSQCLTDIKRRDYNKHDDYFRYCNQNGVMTRQVGRTGIVCSHNGKLKIINFDAYVPKNPKETKCQLSSLRYNQKEDTGCLSQPRRDAIIAPFMAALSGKTPLQVRDMRLSGRIKSGRYEYKQIVLEVGCETESNLKMDMCNPNSKVFPGKANVSLYFDFDTFMENGNHSSCFCYFKTFNTSKRISLRAFDIRLHQLTTLSLKSVQLATDRIYWWQTGVLSSSLAVLKLSGLTPTTVPISVWMDVYGEDMNITCDPKPPENKIRSPSDDSESLSSGYIIAAIIVAAIIVIIIIAVVIKCRKPNPADSPAHRVVDLNDNAASVKFTSLTYDDVDDHPKEFQPPTDYGSEPTANTHVYDHFRDDSNSNVIPTSTNIYDTAGPGIYSSFQTQRQQSKPDNIYD